jgi:hypothetical protein
LNVLIVAPYGANQYHFETDLELAQQHLLKGDVVTLLICSAGLLSCDINLDHHPDQCINCMLRRRRALRTLEDRVQVQPLLRLEPEDRRALRSVRTEFSSLEDLRSYRYGSFDLGMAVVSSIVSRNRDPEPSLRREATRIGNLTLSSAGTYLAMKRRLHHQPCDRVYAFNGRFAIMRAVLRACQEEEGVDCYLHDRGSSIERYALFKNALPHSVDVMDGKIRAAWQEAEGSADRLRIASSFFEGRKRGEAQNWYSFVAGQDATLLPDTWNEKRRNIVVFSSSEDEFVAIGKEWENPLYTNQQSGLIRIVEDLRGVRDVTCHLRLHPNSQNAAVESINRIVELEGGNIFIVRPESPVSSYAMLMASDITLTFGSTMGIEATYWGKPSVLAGQCFYRNLGSTYNPDDHDQLIQLLLQETDAANRLGALMYGYYFATFGEPFVHFRPENLWGGRFRGRFVGPGPVGYRLIRGLRSRAGFLPSRALRFLFGLRAARIFR